MYIEHLARKIGYELLLVYQSVLLILRIKTDWVQEWMSIKIFKNISVDVVSILKDSWVLQSQKFMKGLVRSLPNVALDCLEFLKVLIFIVENADFLYNHLKKLVKKVCIDLLWLFFMS